MESTETQPHIYMYPFSPNLLQSRRPDDTGQSSPSRVAGSCWLSILKQSGGSEGKESACNVGDLGSNPGLGRSPGEGNGNPLQYSCLENPMARGAWWATVHGAANSQTQLSDQHFVGVPRKSAGCQERPQLCAHVNPKLSIRFSLLPTLSNHKFKMTSSDVLHAGRHSR